MFPMGQHQGWLQIRLLRQTQVVQGALVHKVSTLYRLPQPDRSSIDNLSVFAKQKYRHLGK